MTETDARPDARPTQPVEKPWYAREYVAEKPTVTVKPDQIINRQGRDFVLYAGLLDAAHRAGMQGIHTTLVQAPGPHNQETCVCHATVDFPWGSYTGIGDANPGNVTRMIVPHIIRMAETRAKARALRDALNIGMVALEELGGDDNGEAPKASTRSSSGSSPDSAAPSGTTPASPTTGTGARPSSSSSTRRPTSTPGSPPGGGSTGREVTMSAEGPSRVPDFPGDRPGAPLADTAESLNKFARLKATATRLREAGKLTVPDEVLQDFAPGSGFSEIEARCQRLLNLINSAVQRQPSPAG
jgi:hypothetical protein